MVSHHLCVALADLLSADRDSDKSIIVMIIVLKSVACLLSSYVESVHMLVCDRTI